MGFIEFNDLVVGMKSVILDSSATRTDTNFLRRES
jgi:hypothetical protein